MSNRRELAMKQIAGGLSTYIPIKYFEFGPLTEFDIKGWSEISNATITPEIAALTNCQQRMPSRRLQHFR